MGQIVELPAPRATLSSVHEADSPSPDIRTSEVYVVFTSVEETLAAVRVGSQLAGALAAPLTLVHFRAIPYGIPVDQPTGASPAETSSFMQRLRSQGLDLRLRVFLCRNPRRAIPRAFRRHSLVLIGGRRSWWAGRAARWRRALEAAGHFVLFVDGGRHAA
jgi:hypothetical protein